MIKAKDYRLISGAMQIIGEISVDACSLDQKINSADAASIQYPSDLHQFQASDRVILYDCTIDPAGETIGIYRVTMIEELLDVNGVRSSKVTLAPEGTWLLDKTGVPGDNIVDNVTLIQAVYNIKATVQYLMASSFEIGLNNADGFPIGDPQPAFLRTNRLIKPTTTATMLELINTIITPSDNRWRCRADLLVPTIEIGWFGDIQPVTVIHGIPAVTVMTPGTVVFATSGSIMVDDNDTVNSLFIEGGTWTDNTGLSSSLLLWHDLQVPDGFAVTYEVYPEGSWHFRLDKLYDDNGVRVVSRRSRRIAISTIVPDNSSGDPAAGWVEGAPPSGFQVVKASQVLLEAGVDYLNERSRPKTTIAATINESTLGRFNVGDRIYTYIVNQDGSIRYGGLMYVAGRTIIWDIGKVASKLELSTILESITDPLSREYNRIAVPDKATMKQGNYQATVQCNGPTVTYNFTENYANIPKITNITATRGKALTVTIASLTYQSVTFATTSIEFPFNITFIIVPKK